MKTATLGSKDYPGVYATVTVPDNVELPAQLEVRMLDKDYKSTVLWWHYDEQGNDTRTFAEGHGRTDT